MLSVAPERFFITTPLVKAVTVDGGGGVGVGVGVGVGAAVIDKVNVFAA